MTSAVQQHPERCAGFSLMEVNIALLLVAIGLMSLLSLFPVGLRQSTLATSDTAQAAFADQVFNAMRANAATYTNWSDSTDTCWTKFQLNALSEPQALTVDGTGDTTVKIGQGVIRDYMNVKESYIAYSISISTGSVDRIWQAQVQVSDRPGASPTNSPVYVTEFVYMGM